MENSGADDDFFFFLYFSEKIMLDITCESSATYNVKHYFLWKIRKKKMIWKCRLPVMTGTLRVNPTALRMAETLQIFEHSDCHRVKIKRLLSAVRQIFQRCGSIKKPFLINWISKDFRWYYHLNITYIEWKVQSMRNRPPSGKNYEWKPRRINYSP